MQRSTEPSAARFILTTQCPDTTGIVAAVTGFLAAQNASIAEAQHFDDTVSNTSFLRVVFRDNGAGLAPLGDLDHRFAAEVGRRFQMSWRFHDAERKCRTIVAVSKHGHCLNSLLHRWSTHTLPVEILAVVSNHEDMRRLAEWHGVPFFHFPVGADKSAQEARIKETFERFDAELLVLARYMQILSDETSRHFAGRCINIHHSFLPGFKGARAYHQAFDRGVKLIGVTAHYVTSDLDEGPIIEQEVGRIDHTHSAEDLADAGRDLESVTLNRAVRWHAERRVFINGHKTVVLR